jgi:hypothetical protein
MSPSRSSAALLLAPLLAALVAGCSSAPPGHAAPDPGVILVTSPDDYAYLNQTDPWSKPHLHDYWGAATVKALVDLDDEWHADLFALGGYFANGYYPADGDVVPQGTGNLTVTVTFQEGVGDRHGQPVLWYRSAAMQHVREEAIPIPPDGSPITIPVGPDEADLPHVSLSGWFFEVGVPAEEGTGLGRFDGTMHLHVDAHRGRPIPLFPGHPDAWQGRSEIALFSGDGTTAAQTNEQNGLCTPLPPMTTCPKRWRPDNGTTVPYDASYVEVRLTPHVSPRGLTLAYHGADTRALTTVEPDEQAGGVQVYRIPVLGKGDSPYAKQSLWEFVAVGQGGRTVEWGTYSISASALKEQPITPGVSS